MLTCIFHSLHVSRMMKRFHMCQETWVQNRAELGERQQHLFVGGQPSVDLCAPLWGLLLPCQVPSKDHRCWGTPPSSLLVFLSPGRGASWGPRIGKHHSFILMAISKVELPFVRSLSRLSPILGKWPYHASSNGRGYPVALVWSSQTLMCSRITQRTY